MGNYVLNRDGGKSDELGFSNWMKETFGQGVINIRTTTSWKVTQRGAGANMSVDIAPGNGLIAIGTYVHVAFSDATNNINISTADPTNPRIDTVVAYIDRSIVSNASNNNPGALRFTSVSGTAAGSPTAPSAGTIQSAVGASNPYIVLANVAVAAATSNIVNANITDTRVSIAYAGKLYGGSSNTVGHTIPNVADDTVALLSAAQTFSNKTFTAPTISSPVITGDSGWQTLSVSPNTVTYNGNGSYSLVFNSVDLTGTVSNGMRLKTTRTVTAPTKCTSLDGSTQYYSKSSPAGMTFTDDFVAMGWIKLDQYNTSTNATIVGRFNGTNGWGLYVGTDGRITLFGNNGSGNYSQVTSYQSVPLNKWVHIAAQLDMSSFTATTTTSYIMVDGVDVPSFVSRAGTNPTAFVQAGNLEIGSNNGGSNFLKGKMAQVAIFNAKVTQSTIRGYVAQGLSGSETSLVSAYSFNNSVNDLSANANNLTANGSAVATTTDSPFTQDDTATPTGTTDYGIIMSKSFSTNTTLTVQTPEGCTIPTSGGVSAAAYSAQSKPYGFPSRREKWELSLLIYSVISASGSTTNTYYNPGGINLPLPIGNWVLSGHIAPQSTPTGTVLDVSVALSTSASSYSDIDLLDRQNNVTASGSETTYNVYISKPVSVSSTTPYYVIIMSQVAVSVANRIAGVLSATNPVNTRVSAINGYL